MKPKVRRFVPENSGLKKGRSRLLTGIRNARGVIVRSISAILRVWVLFYVYFLTLLFLLRTWTFFSIV